MPTDIIEGSILEFAATESFAATTRSKAEVWLDAVEAMLGRSLDGDQERDGYSIDLAYEAFRAGISVEDHVSQILWSCTDIELLKTAHARAWIDQRSDHQIIALNRLRVLGGQQSAPRHVDRRSEIERDYDEEAEAMAMSVTELVRGYQL